MSWIKIILETNSNPDEGDLVQSVSMHILAWERLVRDYDIDGNYIADLDINYLRTQEESDVDM